MHNGEENYLDLDLRLSLPGEGSSALNPEPDQWVVDEINARLKAAARNCIKGTENYMRSDAHSLEKREPGCRHLVAQK